MERELEPNSCSARYAEDFSSGQIFDLGKKRITKSEILEFARKFDPFPFHVDETYAEKTVFGGLIASGWHTALIWLGMMHERLLTYETILGSPGHDSLIWKNPVRPGDTISGKVEVIDSRISQSRPELGFVKYRATMLNQNGDEVFFTQSTLMLKSRVGTKV